MAVLDPGQALLAVGGAVFAALGVTHGALAVRDLWRPTAFTPADDRLRESMADVPMRFGGHRTSMWRAWLGFNLSHSLGLMVFGGFILIWALQDSTVAQDLWLQVIGTTIGLVYLVLAVRFWFYGPVVGCVLGILCFVASWYLSS